LKEALQFQQAGKENQAQAEGRIRSRGKKKNSLQARATAQPESCAKKKKLELGGALWGKQTKTRKEKGGKRSYVLGKKG